MPFVVFGMPERYGVLSGALNENRLRYLYEVELRTDGEIGILVAGELGLDKPFGERAVARLRRVWSIPTLSMRQRRERRDKRRGPSLDELTPKKLLDLYERMGEREIAKLHGVKRPAIRRLRDEWKIAANTKRRRVSRSGSIHEPNEAVMRKASASTRVKGSREVTKECEVCGLAFNAVRSSHRFCGEACAAVHRRRYNGKARKNHRVFTCQNSRCGKEFTVGLMAGRPKHCPKCQVDLREAEELQRRTKVCGYRHCNRRFVDHSRQNSGKFCHVEHRRREKLFRQGDVVSISDFRKPDPILS